MGLVRRLFDRRDTWARMVLLDLSGLSYLLAGMSPRVPSTTQWLLAVAAFAGVLVLCRRPALSFAVQAALLAVALVLLDDPTINQVGAGWTLAELTVWAATYRAVGVGALALTTTGLLLDVLRSGDPLPGAVFNLILLTGVPLLIGLVIRTTRELADQAERRADADRLLAEAARRRRESESRAARADERAAIARELHDVVAHHVASMVLRAGVARHVLPGLDPRVAEVLDDVHRTGTAGLTDLRRLVEVLRSPAGAAPTPADPLSADPLLAGPLLAGSDGADPGAAVRDGAALTTIEPGSLPAALGAALEVARRAGVIVASDIDERAGTLDAVRGLAVLRLTQEALTNVAKHAGITPRARLLVAVDDAGVHWEVTDDGGRPPSGPATPGSTAPGVSTPGSAPPGSVLPGSALFGLASLGGGHGLVGMRERAEVLGGVLAYGPVGTGWAVRTTLPVLA